MRLTSLIEVEEQLSGNMQKSHSSVDEPRVTLLLLMTGSHH